MLGAGMRATSGDVDGPLRRALHQQRGEAGAKRGREHGLFSRQELFDRPPAEAGDVFELVIGHACTRGLEVLSTCHEPLLGNTLLLTTPWVHHGPAPHLGAEADLMAAGLLSDLAQTGRFW